MQSRARTWPGIAVAAAALGGGLASLGSSAAASPGDDRAASAPMLSPVRSQGEIAGPDLECFDTPGAPLQLELRLSHLDPALVQLGLPDHSAAVRELAQTCIAVERSGMPRPAAALAVVPPMDLACYRIDTAPLPEPALLDVKHQNPMLALLPGHPATLVRPAELCLPVARDGVAPRPDVRRLVQFVALECYAVDPAPHAAFGIGVTALDPQLAGAADRQLAIGAERRQICVPVAKNSERIPRDVLGVLRQIGTEQLAASRPAAAPATPGAQVVLRHLNPLLATLPAVPVVLQQASGLMVPVSRRAPPAL